MIDWSQMKTAEQQAEDARKALVPFSVAQWQGEKTLKRMGLWDSVVEFVESLEGDEREDAEIGLYKVGSWRRHSPFVLMCASVLGLSERQLDDMFIEASLLFI